MDTIDESYKQALEAELRFAVAKGSDRVDAILAELARVNGAPVEKPVRKATSKKPKEQRG